MLLSILIVEAEMGRHPIFVTVQFHALFNTSIMSSKKFVWDSRTFEDNNKNENRHDW